jgi:hypothetical protein
MFDREMDVQYPERKVEREARTRCSWCDRELRHAGGAG